MVKFSKHVAKIAVPIVYNERQCLEYFKHRLEVNCTFVVTRELADAARDAAAELQGPDVQAIIESQADWVTIQFIGEFEAPEWEVLPDSLVGT